MSKPLESIVYSHMKSFLGSVGWRVIAGEPPIGTDHMFPIFEMHDPDYRGRGSTGSKKIDLLAYKNPYFLLIELKDMFEQSDVDKLDSIVGDVRWRESFSDALKSKSILDANEIDVDLSKYVESPDLLIKGIGYGGSREFQRDDYVVFHFESIGNSIPKVVLGNSLLNKGLGPFFTPS